ncbi:MAG: hypothetical protein D6690_14570 [Nitrospirae bacterium]|nr:MAG: hypothetical protein D6690_14570 [Nitrospirota bacterium]
MNAITLQVNARNLVQHLQFAFTKRTTFLAELMQNARRAGATEVSFTYDETKQQLTVSDDGCGIANMATLLTVAESGWDSAIQEAEHPYGLGFLSALFAASYVTVESNRQRIAFAPSAALNFEPIPIALSSVEAGTRIVLDGITFNPEGALYDYARGFPIPVYFNGTALPRPHALDSGLEFQPYDEGQFSIFELHAPLRGTRIGTKDVVLYLQGLPIRQVRPLFRGREINIVHLDRKRFTGRLPDRDTLVDESTALNAITSRINNVWRERLQELASTLPQDEFAQSSLATLTFWNALDLLDSCPFLPPQVLDRYSSYPRACDDHSLLLDRFSSEPIPREQFESKTLTVFQVLDQPYAGDPFQRAMYLFTLQAPFIWRTLLEPSHWIHRYVIPLSDDDLELELCEPYEYAVYRGHWIYDTPVVFCKSAIIHGPAGPARISRAFVYGQDPIRNLDCLPPSHRRELVVVPESEHSGDVVEQLCEFIDDSDHYHEDDAIREAELFERFILSHRRDTAGALLKRILKEANAQSYPNLCGKTFAVRIDSQTIHIQEAQ